MNICIVGNKGSFFHDIVVRFNEEGISTRCYYSDDILSMPLDDALNADNCSTLLFIGGETRFEEKMVEHNIALPSKLLSFCAKSQLKFVYLSTLSVFGWNNSDLITISSERSPYDLYGVTKNDFDTVRESVPFDNYVALYPASIDSGRGRSSVERFESLMCNYTILRYFRLPGCLSIVTREKLIDRIFYFCVNSNDVGDFIVSDHRELSDFARSISFPIPRFPNALFRLMKVVIGPKKAMLLKMLLRGVQYR